MADPNNNNNRGYNQYEYHPYPQLYKNLPTSPDYLFQEEAITKGRTWGENLQYYTGSAYLTGAVLGGTKGAFQGIMDAERGESLKVRTNRILNSGGQTGRKFGNSLGVVGLIYSLFEAGMIKYRGDDAFSSVLAGLSTGAIYRYPSGVRGAAIAGAIGGIVAGAAVSGKQAVLPMLKRYVPNIPI